MLSVIVIVPRFNPILRAILEEKFAGDPRAAIIVDRRVRQRRQQVQMLERGRRGGVDRRLQPRLVRCALVVPLNETGAGGGGGEG